jgi:PTS system ascorbate-specific IIA component
MKVGIMLITHGRIGSALLDSTISVLDVHPLPIRVLDVAGNCDPDKTLDTAEQALAELNSGDGVLVLTDLYGSTPSNIACKLRHHGHVRVVSGINLPMLIRVLNYPGLDLDGLKEKALSGGRDGVLSCTTEDRTHAG